MDPWTFLDPDGKDRLMENRCMTRCDMGHVFLWGSGGGIHIQVVRQDGGQFYNGTKVRCFCKRGFGL